MFIIILSDFQKCKFQNFQEEHKKRQAALNDNDTELYEFQSALFPKMLNSVLHRGTRYLANILHQDTASNSMM